MQTITDEYNAYFTLVRNLPAKEKLKLISKISNSIVEEKQDLEKKFLHTFGGLDIKESAEELIESIHTDRYFEKVKSLTIENWVPEGPPHDSPRR
jgi:hypothetical protein